MSVSPKVRMFRDLHASGCFVMPNPWDAGSARMLAQLGFPALATTSAGMAWSMGRADNQVALEARAGAPAGHRRRGGRAGERRLRGRLRRGPGAAWPPTSPGPSPPVSPGCRSKTPLATSKSRSSPSSWRSNACARRARPSTPPAPPCCSPGDPKASSPAGPICARRFAAWWPTPRPAPSASTRRASARPRTSARWCGRWRRVRSTCLPIPTSRPSRSWPALGVRRISVGGALARTAWGGFMAAAQEIAGQGTFTRLAQGLPSAELNQRLGG